MSISARRCLQPPHQLLRRQAPDGNDGHIRQTAPPDDRLIQLQLRCAQMAADEAGVGADRLGKGVLRSLDGVLHLRAGGAALFPCLILKSNGPGPFKQDNAKSIDKLPGRRIKVRADICHGVIDHRLQRPLVQLLHTIPLEILQQRADDEIRNIAAGGQAVNGIGMDGKTANLDSTVIEIASVGKQFPDAPVCDRTFVLLLHVSHPMP